MTIVRGRQDHLARQREWLHAGMPGPVAHVVVVMGGPDPDAVLRRPGPPVTRVDLDVDGPLPLARARNVGVRTAAGLGADLVVLLDVDLLPLPRLVHAYAAAATSHPDDVLVGPVRYLAEGRVPHGPETWDDAGADPREPPPRPDVLERPELLWSLSTAMTVATWDRIGGFHEGYLGYGAEDTDFGRLVAASGTTIRWVPDARGLHQWHPTSPPTERAADLVRNATTYHERWGEWPMADWLTDLHDDGLVHFDPDRDELRLLAHGKRPGT